MKLAAGTLCMQTLLTRSRVLLQTENVHIAQIDVHEYDSMALPPPRRATGALSPGSNLRRALPLHAAKAIQYI